MPGKYINRSDAAKANGTIEKRAQRAAQRDLIELHDGEYRVLLDGYRREMRREVFGDPDYRVPHHAESAPRGVGGRFTSTTEGVK